MGLFDWFKADEEDKVIGEISNDAGDHVVFEVPAKKEGKVRRIMRENKIEHDRDEQASQKYNAAKRNQRDPHQHRYHMDKVVNPNEDLEPEVDNDSITERNEQAAEGGWFSNWW